MMAFVNEACRSWLEPALADDFAGLADRRVVDGRTPHFSGRLNGHPILVRTPSRGGVCSFLGWRHVTARRVRREAEALQAARSAGLNVPELLAYRVQGRLFKRITCVYTLIEGVQTLDRALDGLAGPARWELLRRVATAVRTLHRAEILHGDLNARNILVGREIHLVDLDAARRGRRGGLREVFRLCRSLQKLLGPRLFPTDKARLLRAYIEPKWSLKPTLARCERSIARHRCWWKMSGAA